MKGRQNYLCRQKLYDIEKQPVLSGMEEVEQYPKLREWEETHQNRRPRGIGLAAGLERAVEAH